MSNVKKFKRNLVTLYLFAMPMLAQAADAKGSGFKTGLGKVMGVGAVISFGYGVFCFYEGVKHWRNGQPIGHDIIAVLLCAGGIAICTLIFGAFSLSDATVPASFDGI